MRRCGLWNECFTNRPADRPTNQRTQSVIEVLCRTWKGDIHNHTLVLTVLEGPHRKKPQRFCVFVSRSLSFLACSARLASNSLLFFRAINWDRRSKPVGDVAWSPVASGAVTWPLAPFGAVAWPLAPFDAVAWPLAPLGAVAWPLAPLPPLPLPLPLFSLVGTGTGSGAGAVAKLGSWASSSRYWGSIGAEFVLTSFLLSEWVKRSLTSARVGRGTSALHTKKSCSWQKKKREWIDKISLLI